MATFDCGAAIFETPTSYDPTKPSPGYKCIAGEEPVRIFGTNELETSCRWLTNISLEDSYHTQLKNTPRVMDDKYLRILVSSMLVELGMKSKSFEYQSRVIANLHSNIFRLAANFYGMHEHPNNAFASGLPNLINHFLPTVNSKDVQDAANKAVLSYTTCECRNQKNSRNIEYTSVILPRVEHAKHILSRGQPFDDFEFVSSGKLPPASHRNAWVLNNCHQLPMLLNVNVRKIDPQYHHLINWGNGGGVFKAGKANYEFLNSRAFITSNEFEIISRFSDIEILNIAISNTPAEVRYDLPDNSGLSSVSYSYGVLAENIWCSLTRNTSGQYKRTPFTAWVHSEDRMRCLIFAHLLSQSGFNVKGYGYGRIVLSISHDQRSDLFNFCFKTGLLPSMDLAIGQDSSSFNFDLSTHSGITNYIYANALLDDFLNLDSQFVESTF